MHSKWKIWDFLKSRPDVLKSECRIIALSCFDPLAFKIVKESINKKLFAEEKLNILLGKELNSNWFDDNFRSLGLFGNSDSYLVHFANEIPKEIGEMFLDPEELLLDGRYVILNFAKEDTLFKKLMKSKSELIETIQIQAPAFWEDNELIDFLCQQNEVYLTIDGKGLIKEKIPFDINSYNQILSQIKINFPDKTNVDRNDIEPLINESKIDQFELAELFGSKKLKLFYKKLIELVQNEQELIGTLYFLQSHLLKMYDLSYLDGKSRLTKYDKQIMTHSKLWKKDDLARAVSYLGELLTKSKIKDPFLGDKIQKDLLKLINY